MNATERLLHRRQTREFIAADSVSVILTRRPKVTTAAGGKARGAPMTLDAQRFRVIPVAPVERHDVSSAGGEVRAASWRLLGLHDANVEPGDEFELDGQWYTVHEISSDREYETTVSVVERGGA